MERKEYKVQTESKVIKDLQVHLAPRDHKDSLDSQVQLDLWVPMVILDLTGHLDPLDQPELKEFKDRRVSLDLTDNRDLQEVQEFREQQVHAVIQVSEDLEHQALLVHLAQLEQPDQADSPGRKDPLELWVQLGLDHKDFKVNKDNLAVWELRDHKDLMDQSVFQVQLDLPEHRAAWDSPVLLDHKASVSKALLDLEDLKVPLDRRDLKVHLVHLDQLEQMLMAAETSTNASSTTANARSTASTRTTVTIAPASPVISCLTTTTTAQWQQHVLLLAPMSCSSSRALHRSVTVRVHAKRG